MTSFIGPQLPPNFKARARSFLLTARNTCREPHALLCRRLQRTRHDEDTPEDAPASTRPLTEAGRRPGPLSPSNGYAQVNANGMRANANGMRPGSLMSNVAARPALSPAGNGRGPLPLPTLPVPMPDINSPAPRDWPAAVSHMAGPIHAGGLYNEGNTCYLNAVLQVLAHTPPLAALALGRHHVISCPIRAPLQPCTWCLLLNQIGSMLSRSTPTHPGPVATRFRALARQSEFGRQQDAHELYVHALDGLDKACLRLAGRPTSGAAAVPRSPGGNAPCTHYEQIFGSSLESLVRCGGCGGLTKRRDPSSAALSLELPPPAGGLMWGVPPSVPLSRLLHHFTRAEPLGGANAYDCESCGPPARPAVRRLLVASAPMVLGIHIKRFDWAGAKLGGHVSCDPVMDLAPFMPSPDAPAPATAAAAAAAGAESASAAVASASAALPAGGGPPIRYRLFAVLVHSGGGASSGHYYAHVRDARGGWWCMDDDRVSRSSIQEAQRECAYMVFYARLGDVRGAGNGGNEGTAAAPGQPAPVAAAVVPPVLPPPKSVVRPPLNRGTPVSANAAMREMIGAICDKNRAPPAPLTVPPPPATCALGLLSQYDDDGPVATAVMGTGRGDGGAAPTPPWPEFPTTVVPRPPSAAVHMTLSTQQPQVAMSDAVSWPVMHPAVATEAVKAVANDACDAVVPTVAAAVAKSQPLQLSLSRAPPLPLPPAVVMPAVVPPLSGKTPATHPLATPQTAVPCWAHAGDAVGVIRPPGPAPTPLVPRPLPEWTDVTSTTRRQVFPVPAGPFSTAAFRAATSVLADAPMEGGEPWCVVNRRDVDVVLDALITGNGRGDAGDDDRRSVIADINDDSQDARPIAVRLLHKWEQLPREGQTLAAAAAGRLAAALKTVPDELRRMVAAALREHVSRK